MRPLYAVDAGGGMRHLVAERAHAFPWSELVAMSSETTVRRACAAGAIVRVLPGVYAAPQYASSFHVRADAALLWAPGAAISGVGALFVWGLIDEPPQTVEITVPQADRPRGPSWLSVRRTTADFQSSRVGRLRVVTPAHAIVSGYGAVAESQRAEVVFGAVRKGLAGPRQILAALDRYPRVRMRRSLVRRVRAAEQGAQSFLEERGLRTVFNTDEFQSVVRQHQVVIEGSAYYLDMYDDATHTAVELDGARFHATEAARLNDIRRDAHVATIGILTVRLAYRDVLERPEWCRQIVRDVLSTRR